MSPAVPSHPVGQLGGRVSLAWSYMSCGDDYILMQREAVDAKDSAWCDLKADPCPSLSCHMR